MNNTLNMFSNIAVLVAIATSNANAIGAPKTIVYDNLSSVVECIKDKPCSVAEGKVHQYHERIDTDLEILATAGYLCQSSTSDAKAPIRVKDDELSWRPAKWSSTDSKIDKIVLLKMSFPTTGTYHCDFVGEHKYAKKELIEAEFIAYLRREIDPQWAFNNVLYSGHKWTRKIIHVNDK